MSPSGRDIVVGATSELQWQAHVLQLAALGGFHGLHIRVSHRTLEGLHGPNRQFPRGSDHDDASGFPDLLLVNPARRLLLFAELKTPRGRVTTDQEWWLARFNSVDEVRAEVWRPADERRVEGLLRGD